MKFLCGKKVIIFLKVFFVCVAFTTDCFSAKWRVEVLNDNPDASWNMMARIVLDYKGYPHIFYGERSLDYAYYDETGWNNEQLGCLDSYQALFPAMAVDQNQKAHIVYRNANLSKIVYLTNATGQWEDVLFDGNGSAEAVVIDSQGAPHIIISSFEESSCYHMTQIDGVWQESTIGINGKDFKWILDEMDNLHLVYVNYTPYPYVAATIYYSSYKQGSWSTKTLSGEGYYNHVHLFQFFEDDSQTFNLTYRQVMRTNMFPGSCMGDCYYSNFKHAQAYSISPVWYKDTVETTNHYDESDNTIPSGNSYYFGIYPDDSIARYSYLYKSDWRLSHSFISDDAINTVAVDDDMDVNFEGFDVAVETNGDLHVVYYDKRNQMIKYATNSPMVFDLDKDDDVDGNDVLGLIMKYQAPMEEKTMKGIALQFGSSN